MKYERLEIEVKEMDPKELEPVSLHVRWVDSYPEADSEEKSEWSDDAYSQGKCSNC